MKHTFLAKITLEIDPDKCPEGEDEFCWGMETFLEELPTEIHKGIEVFDARIPSPQEVLGKLALL